MYLIYEFFDILELYKKYNVLSKQKLFKIIQKLLEYKENQDG
jgi:Mor family transcriptional regulator